MWSRCEQVVECQSQRQTPLEIWARLTSVDWSFLQCSLVSQTTRSSWLQMAAMQGTLLRYPVWHHLFAIKLFLWIIEEQGWWINPPLEASLLHSYHLAISEESQACCKIRDFTNTPSRFALWLWTSRAVLTSMMNSSAFCVVYFPGLGIATLFARPWGPKSAYKAIFHDVLKCADILQNASLSLHSAFFFADSRLLLSR